MKKIQSLFQRNYDSDRQVRNEVLPGSEWVVNGEGIATEKFDGTSCWIDNGNLFKRYDAKNGKTPPEGFIPAQNPDPTTGHWPGWLPVYLLNKEDQYHIEAFDNLVEKADGTYELIGPKVQSNKHNFDKHVLVKHGLVILESPRDYEGLKKYFESTNIEGIVWHHPNGSMVKIKKKDFGLNW